MLLFYYNLLLWGIAYVFANRGSYLAASVVQVVLLGYVAYYAVIFPGEVESNAGTTARR